MKTQTWKYLFLAALALALGSSSYYIFHQWQENKLEKERQEQAKPLEPHYEDTKVLNFDSSFKEAVKQDGIEYNEKLPPQIDSMPRTKIKFENSVFDFGTLKEGEVVQHEFHFTNTGNAPFVIAQANGSCGCTVPEWPKEPTMPGKSNIIKVTFNSSGKEGEQNKTVKILGNTEPNLSYLVVKGKVIPNN